MKRFKIGFAAIIAILAISVTVASYAGAFKHTKAAPAANECYGNLQVCATATLPAINLVIDQSTCSAAQARATAGAKVISVSNIIADPDATCDNGSLFCCARITGVVQPTCAASTAVISAVECKFP